MTRAQERYARIAELACEAQKHNLPATAIVADAFNVSLRYASTLMHRARNAGWVIPHSDKTMTPARQNSIDQLQWWRSQQRETTISQPDFDRNGWREHANCKGINPNLFHPEQGGSGRDVDAAKAVCSVCTVRQECLDYALDNYEMFGIWGGTSERQRRRIRHRRFTEQRMIEVRPA